MSNRITPHDSNVPVVKTGGKVAKSLGQILARHAGNGVTRLQEEKARVELAKLKVESRRKAGSSIQRLDTLRYGPGLDDSPIS